MPEYVPNRQLGDAELAVREGFEPSVGL
jgi:hypothetical protein